MPKKPDQPLIPEQKRPSMKWELDGHHTNTLFKLARQTAGEQIQRYRMRLIELDHFEPQPQRYDLHTESFVQFDNHTKEDCINDLKRWIAAYEKVAQFCLKMEPIVMQYEAEQFAEQMAQMFGGRGDSGRR